MPAWRKQRSGPPTANLAKARGHDRSSPHCPAPNLPLHCVIGKLANHGAHGVRAWPLAPCRSHNPERLGRRGAGQRLSPAAPLIDPAFLAVPADPDRMVARVRLMRQIRQQPATAGIDRSGRARTGKFYNTANRRADRRFQPSVRRHGLPPGGQLPNGLWCERCSDRQPAGSRPAETAGDEHIDHAAHRRWQSRRADDHDCREGHRPDQGSSEQRMK